mgnify:CR=1 FL=1
MIEKVTEYLISNKDLTASMVNFLLKPENLERLKNNPGLVKQLTKIKTLPSSIRLYLRNLAGVTDKITEDFFSKSELAEIKKRVAEAEANKSMGKKSISGEVFSRTAKNAIGYRPWDRLEEKGKMTLEGVFTNPSTNIDMSLGQASFSTDEKGNITVTDKHNFDSIAGAGYAENKYFPDSKYVKHKQVVPHRDTHDDIKEALQDPETPEKEKEWYESIIKAMPNQALSYEIGESNKQLLKRAHKALQEGTIDPSKYARIIAGLHQGEEIPIELNIGNITQEDKYKANPEFAKYIASDTMGFDPNYPILSGKQYENVGIPSLIRNLARQFIF